MKKLIQAFWVAGVFGGILAVPAQAGPADWNGTCSPFEVKFAEQLPQLCPDLRYRKVCLKADLSCQTKSRFICSTTTTGCVADTQEILAANRTIPATGTAPAGGSAGPAPVAGAPSGNAPAGNVSPGSPGSISGGGSTAGNGTQQTTVTPPPTPSTGSGSVATVPARDPAKVGNQQTLPNGNTFVEGPSGGVTVPKTWLEGENNPLKKEMEDLAGTPAGPARDQAYADFEQKVKDLRDRERGASGSEVDSTDLANAREAQSAKEKTGKSADSDDECATSVSINDSYRCKGARGLITTGQIMAQAGQVAGSVGTTIAGNSAQSAAAQEGTASAAMTGAAKTQKAAALSQLAVGATNFMMGMMQMMRGSKHKKNANEIRTGLAEKEELYHAQENGLAVDWEKEKVKGDLAVNVYKTRRHGSARAPEAERIIEAQAAYQAADARLKAAVLPPDVAAATTARNKARRDLEGAKRTAAAKTTDAAREIGRDAIGEQNGVAQDLSDAGLSSMLMSAQQIGQGAIGMAAARNLEEAAKKIKEGEGTGLTIAPGGQDPFPEFNPRGSTVVTGDGSNPNGDQSPVTDGPTDEGGGPPLGTGLPPIADNGIKGEAPKPGAFVPGGGGGGGGAGGGPSLGGGGSTQAPAGDAGEKGPTAANPNVAGATPYSGGGLPAANVAGGREDRINPADMMAAAMGLFKKDQEEKNPSSQHYNGANRGIASGFSGLAMPGDDLFKIIEDGYRTQIKAGNI